MVAVADTIGTTGKASPVRDSGGPEARPCSGVAPLARCDADKGCACEAGGATDASEAATLRGCSVAAKCGAGADIGCVADAPPGRCAIPAACRVATVTDVAGGNLVSDGGLEKALSGGAGRFAMDGTAVASPVVAARLFFRLGWASDGAATVPKTAVGVDAGWKTGDADDARFGDAAANDDNAVKRGAAGAAVFCGTLLCIAAGNSA